MKSIFIFLFFLIFPSENIFSKEFRPCISFENKFENEIINAIKSDDYDYFITSFSEGGLDVNQIIKGKTLLIYASIFNKPEMINLLISQGAFFSSECDDGYTAMDHAIKNNSIKAIAELIVISA
jgi:ankyrin repeat protein